LTIPYNYSQQKEQNAHTGTTLNKIFNNLNKNKITN
jgi:hypothetical protein